MMKKLIGSHKKKSIEEKLPAREEIDLKGLWDKCAWDFLKRLDGSQEEVKASWADYEQIKMLGEGGFGKVLLSRHKRDNYFMATKIMDKEYIVKMKQIHLATNEKNILFLCDFIFILKMITAFQTNDFVCIGLELAPGGDLFDVMDDTLPFSPNITRFYAGQIMLGLQYLSTIQVVYRDLKPENILIAANGYVKLADFGFAKLLKSNPRTFTFCGTPDYIAPEIIMNKGYGLAVDWWSFGVMVYEMLIGNCPFYSDDQMRTFKYICKGAYRIPDTLSNDCKSIIKCLLQVETSRRYGNLRNGALDVRYHPFFKLTDWKALFDQKIKPPFPIKNPDFSQIEKDPEVNKIVDKSDSMRFAKEFKFF